MVSRAAPALLLASAALRFAAAQVAGQCDPGYECSFTAVDSLGNFIEYDFSSLCRTGNNSDYYILDPVANQQYYFNVCGYANQNCLPNSHSEAYEFGTAVQVYNLPQPACNATSPKCVNRFANITKCCTMECEVLATGVPQWSLLYPSNPGAGVSVTYQSVSTDGDDGNKCPIDPTTGTYRDRAFRLNIMCDNSVPTLNVLNVRETSMCSYTVNASSKLACGCIPQCTGNRMCGPDGCGGYCSGPALLGACPTGEKCLPDGSCCRTDCRGRSCGDDGCGGVCNTCGPDETCTPYQVCVQTAPYVPGYAVTFFVDSGSLVGAYVGGIGTTIVLALIVWFFTGGKASFDRWRYGFSEPSAGVSLFASAGAGKGGKDSAAAKPVASYGASAGEKKSYAAYGTTSAPGSNPFGS